MFGTLRLSLLITVPFVCLTATASFATPLTLTGSYLQVGISDYGTFGSDASAEPGLLHDPAGTGSFYPGGIANDYLTPGTPHDGFAINSRESGFIGNDNASISGFGMASPVLLTGVAAKGFDNAASWTVTDGTLLTINNSYFFNTSDEQIKVVTTITALSSLTNLAFARSEDPDPDYNRYGDFQTVNTRGDSITAPQDLVSAAGQETGLTLGILNQSGTTFVHNTAVSASCCSTQDPYTTLANTDTLAYPTTTIADSGLQMAWSLGNLAAGESATIAYSYVFGAHQGTVSAPTAAVINTTDGDVTPNTFSLASSAATASPVEFDGGILQMSGGTFAGNVVTAPVTIDATNGSIDTSTGSGGFSGAVSGPGSLTIAGGGTFSLTGANTYAGGTIVDASTVAVGTATALGTGGLALNGGKLQAAADGLTIANAAALTGIATIDTQAFGLTYAGVVSGTGQLVKAGTGALTLAAANSYTGGTVLNAGTLAVGNAAALGTGALTVNLGTLQAAADGLDLANGVVLAGNGAIDTQGYGFTASGVLSGPAGLTKLGTGTLTLTGDNSYAGGTALQAGTLVVGNNNAIGTGALSMADGTTLAVTSGVRLANAAVLTGRDTFLTTLGTVGGEGLVYDGVISGTGTLVKAGDGASGLRLTAANTYAGGTVLAAGHIGIANDAALGTGTVTFAGGFLVAHAGGYTLRNAAVLAQNGTIDTNGFGMTYAGAIAGTGQLAKAGLGTLSLTAANSYSGGTALNAGTIAVGNAAALGTGAVTFNGGGLQAGADKLALANAAVLASNATVDTQGFGLTLAGTVSGAGALTKLGVGTLALTAANSYSGGTALNAGTLALGNGTALGTGTVTFGGGVLQAGAAGLVVRNAAVLASDGAIDTQTYALTVAGGISGAGALTKAGLGTLTLTGPNSYAGGTLLNAGTLALGNAAALGTGTATFAGGSLQAAANGLTVTNALTLARNGALDTQGFGLTVAGPIAGPSGLTKTGLGTLTLSGANSYGGGTALTAGTVAIATSTALGTGTVTFGGGSLRAAADGLTLANAATLARNGTIDTQGFGLTASGPIDGASGLTKTGTGTLALTGANSYAGGTALNAGAIAIGTGAALGTGAVTFAGGTLRAAAEGLTLANAAVLATFGTIDTQAFGLTQAGAISGPGGLVKAGSGTLALTGANTYAGGTALAAGIVNVGNSAALGTGALSFAGGTLQAGADGLAIGNAATLASNGTIDTQAFGLTASGIVSGASALTKVGTGTLSLTGINTYAGGTALNAGTLAVGNGSALGTGALLFGGGTLQAGADKLTLANAMTLASDATIDTQAFGLTAAGMLSGAGGLTKRGTGTLSLTGANTYAGGTALNAGTLAIGNAAALGTGTVTFGGGTLQAGADGLTLANAAVLASNATIDTQGFGFTQAGAVSGAGGLTKLGAGTLSLTGANSYAGGTALNGGAILLGNASGLGTGALTFNGGTLRAGADGLAVANAATLAGNGTVDTQGSTLTLSGAVDGAGALTKEGAGTLALTGANSYAGGTAVKAGIVAIGTGTALGTGPVSMDDGTTLQFLAPGLTLANAIVFTGIADPTIDTGSGSQTISGPISGSSALTKTGSGTLDLTGTDTYTGATIVQGGMLVVDGSIANSVVTVENGAGFGGGGTIGGLQVQSGSVIAPGVRTLTIAGNVTFAAGATYLATIDADGTSSRLAIGGTATLGGATLSLATGSGTFGGITRATLLTATGGIAGTFGTVAPDTNLAFLAPSVSYTPTSVDLTLTRNAAAIPSVAVTPNQAGVAGAIAALPPGSPLYNAVLGQSADGARQAFNATSGVSHSSTQRITTSTTRMLTGVVVDRLWDVGGSGLSAQQVVEQFGTDGSLPALVRCYGPVPATPAPAPQSYTAWGEGFGTFGHTDGGANAGSLDRSLGGFVLGIDTPLSGVGIDHWRAGVAVGYSDTTYTSHIDGGSGTVQSVFGSVYGGARYGAIDVRLGATVSGQQTDAQRMVAFPGFLETEKSSNGGMTVQGFGEVGYRIPYARFVFEPVAGAAILHVHQDGFRESGGVAALVAQDSDNLLGTTTLGVRSEVAPLAGVPLLAHVFLGWQHLIGNASPLQTLAFAAAPANSFSVSGAPIDRDALAAEVALDYRQSAALDLGLTYAGAVGATAVDHSIKGRIEYRF